MDIMQLPAHLAGRRPLGTLNDAMAGGLGVPSHPRISTRANRFTLVDAAGNEVPANFMDPMLGVYLDVVIVEINPTASRVFYEKEYDPSAEPGPPECFSDNGVAPSSQSSKPQSATCSGCPWNEWGSDVSRISGKAVKACGTIKKMAVLVVGDPQRMLYELRCSTVTLKHVRAYAQYLAQNVVQDATGQRQVSPADVVTRLSFDKTVQGVLNFFAQGFVPADMVPLIDNAWQTGAGADIVGLNDKPFAGAVLAAPAAAVMLPAPSAAQLQMPPPPPPPPPMNAPVGFGGIPAPQASGFGAPAPSPTPVGAPAQSAPVTRKRRTKAEIEAEKMAGLQANTPAAIPAAQPGFGAQQPAPAFLAQPQPPGFAIPPAAPPPASLALPADNSIPAFLNRAAPPPAAPPAAAPAQTFGMQPQAPPPPAALADAVAAAFSLPIPPR